jgi:hypothetical protein
MSMAKATTTMRQGLQYQPQHADWFAATQALFNRVAAFYFEVIGAHEGILDLSNKEALTALEKLTHATVSNPHPVMPLSEIVEDMPAMFRRAAIHAALGSLRTLLFCSPQEVASEKGKSSGQGEEVHRTSSCASTRLEQGSHPLRRHVEGPHVQQPGPQSLDRDVLELAQMPTHWSGADQTS